MHHRTDIALAAASEAAAPTPTPTLDTTPKAEAAR
jgi:hypothetical protein